MTIKKFENFNDGNNNIKTTRLRLGTGHVDCQDMQIHLDCLEEVNGGKMKDVTCKNCDWKWDIEKDDENPYLCHKCGYDNKKNKFDHKALKKWKDENP